MSTSESAGREWSRMLAARDAADAINAANARTSARADAAAGFVVALLLGILGALALVHWLTPCEAGHLCAAGALLPERGRALLLYLARPLRRAYLRTLIRSLEREAQWHADTLELAPHYRRHALGRAQALRVELADLYPPITPRNTA